MATRKRVAVYVRCSTDHQDTASQRHAIQEYLDSQGWNERADWYEEQGVSGRQQSRPELDRLRKDVQAGRVDVVVVFRLDRLARSLNHGVQLLAELVERARVVSLRESLDLSGSVGRLVAAVLFGLAEIECDAIRDRIKAGMARARAAGRLKGRKPGTTKHDPSRAKELQAKGATVPEICRLLGVGRTTVYRYLSQ